MPPLISRTNPVAVHRKLSFPLGRIIVDTSTTKGTHRGFYRDLVVVTSIVQILIVLSLLLLIKDCVDISGLKAKTQPE